MVTAYEINKKMILSRIETWTREVLRAELSGQTYKELLKKARRDLSELENNHGH
jgi:hypothetical protein